LAYKNQTCCRKKKNTFEEQSLASAVLYIFLGGLKILMDYMTITTPLSGMGIATINLCIKFEVSVFTYYKDLKGSINVEIGVVLDLEARTYAKSSAT